MKISVILPVFNAVHTIERAVRSILNQTFTEFELIIVNDGSTDGTTDIIKRLQLSDSRIKLYHLKHGGIARALNFAIKMSSGRYIARMDADDISLPERLQLQYEYLQKHPQVGLVSCLVNYKGNANENEGYAQHVTWTNTITSHEQVLLKRFQESPFAHPSVCFKKLLVNQFGGYAEGNLPEDYELWLRWLHHGVAMQKVNQHLIDWHDLPHRLSRTHRHYNSENFYRIKAKYLKHYLEKTFNQTLPDLWIWGAGRVINNRVKPLISMGLSISKYIDVKDRKTDDGRFIHFSEIPAPENQFILSFVSDRKGKHEIYKFLIEKGYREGLHFLMMA